MTDQPAARWSGSAAVPPNVPRQGWWSRRAAAGEPEPPADPWADSEDWSATPAVDPWADQDTPWQAEIPFPEAMPPTRLENALPPTRTAAPPPPTRSEAAVPPTRSEAPVPVAAGLPGGAGAAAGPPPSAPDSAKPPRRRGWARRKQSAQPPVNRLPVQSAPPPPPPPPPPTRQAVARPAPPAWPPPARPTQGRPGAAPDRRPLPAPRRRHRHGRKLLLFALLSAVGCCGVPAYLAWPAAGQYPVSAALPQSVADLDLRDDGASRRAVDRLSEQVSGTSLAQGDVFAGVYADGDGKRVTVFGTTGLRLTPQDDVEAEIAHLAEEYKIKTIESFDLGETGVHERCGVGRAGGRAVVVCAWADRGSLATVLLTRRSLAESAELTGVLRSAALTRG